MKRIAEVPMLVLVLCAGPAFGQYEDVAAQVSQPNYTNFIKEELYARKENSRGPLSPQHDAARETILRAFSSFGLSVSLEPFPYQGATFHNVVATLSGKSRPEEYYVVGAHYDSANTPGADDDATGVAALLEVARVASMHDFEASIVFVAFDREEAGLIGSRAWIAAHSGDRIRGMLQMDMIGYNPPGPNHNLVALVLPDGSPNATWPVINDAVARYGAPVSPVYGGISRGSDHYSFAAVAPAVELIEASFYQNTNYHRETDTVDTPDYIDYAFGSSVSRAVTGYLAQQAGLLRPAPSAARLTAGGVLNSASFIAGPVAPDEFVTLVGSGFDDATSVAVRDSSGEERSAILSYASPSQLNVVLPTGIARGAATVAVIRKDGVRADASLEVRDVAPGVFTVGSNGLGAPAAHIMRVAADGSPTWRDAFACPAPPPSCGPAAIDFGSEDDRVFLVLYGTGIRGRLDVASAALEIDAKSLPVQYAGAQPTFPGLDQVNVELPRTLSGKGIVPATLRVHGRAANPVMIDLGR